MSRTILLTGASGFIGRNLLDVARRSGSKDRWICVDRAHAPCRPSCSLPGGCEFRQVDLLEPGAVAGLLASVAPDAVVHFAGATGKSKDAANRALLLDVNVATTWNLAGSLPKPTYFMIPSTGMIYGNQPGPYVETMEPEPTDEYSLSKLLAEKALLSYAHLGRLRACILRPSVIYGPGQAGEMFVPTLCEAIRNRTRLSMTLGEQTRDFLHVRDFCEATLRLLAKEIEGTFNVGQGESVSMRETATAAMERFGDPELLGLGDVPYREREIWKYEMDTGHLREAAGWRPRIPLMDGLKEIIETKEKP